MKINTLIFSLAFLLAAHNATAQKALSPGVRPYAENWTYSLVRSMHSAGFDMPSTGGASTAKAVVSRNALRLDSTKTFYDYSPNGADGKPLFRSIYQYPQPGTKVEINYLYENDVWQPLDRTTFVSDNQQRLVEATAEVFDAGTQEYRPDSRLEVFPHGDSQELIDSAFTWLWDSTIMDWHIILAIRNTFDDDNRLLKNISSIDYFGDAVVFEEIYSYDDNGDNHLIEEFAVLGDDIFPSSRTDIAYYDHLPIEVTVSAFDGLGFTPESRANYAYTLFGAVRKNMNFERNAETGGWNLVQVIDYFYDSEQRLAGKETKFLYEDGSEERKRVSYGYIDGENLSQEWFHNWDDDLFDWILDSKKFYYYDGLTSVDPDPVTVKTLVAWPNPATGPVQLSLDGEAAVQVFDSAGRLLQTQLLQPGQALDMAGLPAGMYTVAARQADGHYVGKIVRERGL